MEIEEIIEAYIREGAKFLYPSKIRKDFEFSFLRIFEALNKLKTAGIIKSYYQVNCDRCDKYGDKLYSSYADMPKKIKCSCGYEASKLHFAIVVYKVVS